MTRPAVTIDPGMRFGRPSIRGVSVDVIGEVVWAGEPVESVAEGCDLTREQVLVACWFLGRYGIEDAYQDRQGRVRRPGAVWRTRWGAWAWTVDEALWRGDWDVADPPSRGES